MKDAVDEIPSLPPHSDTNCNHVEQVSPNAVDFERSWLEAQLVHQIGKMVAVGLVVL